MPAESTPLIFAAFSPSTLPEAGVDEPGALPGEGDLLSNGHVGRAADHGSGLAVAQVDRGQRQAVGVGVRLHLDDATDQDLVPVPFAADLLDAADLGAGHGQAVGQLLGRYGDGNVLFQPGERD